MQPVQRLASAQARPQVADAAWETSVPPAQGSDVAWETSTPPAQGSVLHVQTGDTSGTGGSESLSVTGRRFLWRAGCSQQG